MVGADVGVAVAGLLVGCEVVGADVGLSVVGPTGERVKL